MTTARISRGQRRARAATLSRPELAIYLGISYDTLTRWLSEGRLPPPLVTGGHARWARVVIDSWLAGKENRHEPA
jgi:excisionase family DNA binding protein